MTRKEASQEAKKRGLFIDKWPDGIEQCRVMRRIIDTEEYEAFVTIGRGDSWEAAFADADKRSDKPQ